MVGDKSVCLLLCNWSREEPLLIDPLCKGYCTINLTVYQLPIEHYQYNFACEKRPPPYNSNISSQLVGPKVFVIVDIVPVYRVFV